jgi:uncharacterized protein
MHELWLELTGIPAKGAIYSITDQAIWQDPIQDFSLPYSIQRSLVADVTVQPQSEGYLIEGSIKGEIIFPCSRCAEPMEYVLNIEFTLFESTYFVLQEEQGVEKAEVSYLRKVAGNYELDIGGILWEQFVLTIPMKPVCSEQCQGLCPHCGHNLNNGPCQCGASSGDARMEIFRKIKLEH